MEPLSDSDEEEVKNKNNNKYASYYNEESEEDIQSDGSNEKNEWYTEKEEEDTYFVFVTNNRKSILAGDQVYYSYGNRSN